MSADAISEAPLLAITPDGIVGDWWMAKAIDTGSAPVGRGGEQPLVEHVLGAVVALLAGLEHEGHPAGQVGAARHEQLGRAGQHRHVGVVAAGVHGAVDGALELEVRVLGHRQGVHVAAEQHGGAGLVAVEHGDHRGRATCRW